MSIPPKIHIDWSAYDPGQCFDAIIDSNGKPRPPAVELARTLGELSPRELAERQQAAENAILETGITLGVYSEGQNIDRAWPFDIVPRPIARGEWGQVEDGLKQRLRALNHFIDDVYHDQRIVKDGRFPGELIKTSKNFLEPCVGANPAHGVWANICGSDLVRDKDGTVYVLEDNLRVPSGVSYMLENRTIIKLVFPELFARQKIQPVDKFEARAQGGWGQTKNSMLGSTNHPEFWEDYHANRTLWASP